MMKRTRLWTTALVLMGLSACALGQLSTDLKDYDYFDELTGYEGVAEDAVVVGRESRDNYVTPYPWTWQRNDEGAPSTYIWEWDTDGATRGDYDPADPTAQPQASYDAVAGTISLTPQLSYEASVAIGGEDPTKAWTNSNVGSNSNAVRVDGLESADAPTPSAIVYSTYMTSVGAPGASAGLTNPAEAGRPTGALQLNLNSAGSGDRHVWFGNTAEDKMWVNYGGNDWSWEPGGWESLIPAEQGDAYKGIDVSESMATKVTNNGGVLVEVVVDQTNMQLFVDGDAMGAPVGHTWASPLDGGSNLGMRLDQWSDWGSASETATIDQIGIYYMSSVDNDFDIDGDVDAADIDMIMAIKDKGYDKALGLRKYDLDDDGDIDAADTEELILNQLSSFYGDADLDEDVDFDDLGILLNNYGADGGWALGDADGSMTVDFDDLGILLNNYGSTAPNAPIAVVPEPASILLLSLGGLTALRRRR